MEKATRIKTLLAIQRIKDDETTFRYKSLSLELKMSKSRVSVLIDGLEQDGYCKRFGSREVRLTPLGLEEIAPIQDELSSLADKLSGKLSLGEHSQELATLLLLYASPELLASL